MTQSRRTRWVEVIGVIVTLAVAGGLLYALLPLLVRPDQQVVPPLPQSAADPTQAFLMVFIAMTAIGAPVTMAAVLAWIVRKLSAALPASSSAAPDTTLKSTVKTARPTAGSSQPKELSPREAMWWKIIATLLVLISIAGITVLLWPTLVRMFS
jgi:hypothetical protein